MNNTRLIAVCVMATSLVGCGANSAGESQRAGAAHAAEPASTTQSGVPDKLRSVIASTLKVDEGRVTSAASFSSDLAADELAMVELVMAYETAFKINIPNADADRFKTVQDVIDYLRAKKVLR